MLNLYLIMQWMCQKKLSSQKFENNKEKFIRDFCIFNTVLNKMKWNKATNSRHNKCRFTLQVLHCFYFFTVTIFERESQMIKSSYHIRVLLLHKKTKKKLRNSRFRNKKTLQRNLDASCMHVLLYKSLYLLFTECIVIVIPLGYCFLIYKVFISHLLTFLT